MVVAKEIKNAEVAYKGVGDIIFTNLNTDVAFKQVISFNEDDLEIEIETYFPLNELQRGWVGDMYYETAYVINIETSIKTKSIATILIKDFLLISIILLFFIFFHQFINYQCPLYTLLSIFNRIKII